MSFVSAQVRLPYVILVVAHLLNISHFKHVDMRFSMNMPLCLLNTLNPVSVVLSLSSFLFLFTFTFHLRYVFAVTSSSILRYFNLFPLAEVVENNIFEIFKSDFLALRVDIISHILHFSSVVCYDNNIFKRSVGDLVTFR